MKDWTIRVFGMIVFKIPTEWQTGHPLLSFLRNLYLCKAHDINPTVVILYKSNLKWLLMIEYTEGIYTFYVYILTNKNKTVLYTGVTNNLEQRLIEHYIAKSPKWASDHKKLSKVPIKDIWSLLLTHIRFEFSL